MNIIAANSQVTITAILRECTPVTEAEFLFEFRFPGGKIKYGTASLVTFKDNDSPVSFVVDMEGYSFSEKDQAELSIYHFPAGYLAVQALYQALALSQTADGVMSLKAKITGVTFNLVYRGLVYCTAETVYFPYNPIEGEFETIEKEAKIYKTR